MIYYAKAKVSDEISGSPAPTNTLPLSSCGVLPHTVNNPTIFSGSHKNHGEVIAKHLCSVNLIHNV